MTKMTLDEKAREPFEMVAADGRRRNVLRGELGIVADAFDFPTTVTRSTGWFVQWLDAMANSGREVADPGFFEEVVV